MTSFEPTLEQRGAIEHALADACVTAGAGSGKTAVLTARYVHLVERYELPVRRIAALTFTEKAAAQMRERIAAALASHGRHADLEEMEYAPISTIHAFCARLLRLHAVDAGLDPAFQVLDEAESLLLREDAFEEALRRLLRAGSPDVAVLSRVATGDVRAEFLGLLEHVRGSGVAPEALRWHGGSSDPASAAAEVDRRLADLLVEAESAGAGAVRRAQELAVRLGEVLPAAGGDAGWKLRALVGDTKAVTPETGRGPRPFQKARRELEEALARASAAYLDAVGRETVAEPLARLLAAVNAAYRERKDERGVLDFADLELRALRLLESLRSRGRRIAGAPDALLVDEVQDTNPLQARLLEALRVRGTPQFSVGDPKQSIYRFRRADVRVIGEEARRVGEAGRHVLRATFRTRPELVDGLNRLHAPLFAAGAAGVDHVPLSAGGRFRDVPGPDLELVVVDAGPGVLADDRRAREADWIAAWVRDLVDRAVPRARVRTSEEGSPPPEPRTLSYGDVAILLRARTSLTIYEDALSALGIPFHTHKGRGFFQTEEVVDLVNALRVIHDPADDHAFACFLTGPIVGVTDADLLRVYPDPSEGRADPGVAWESFVRLARSGKEDPSGRFVEVVRCVERLRREALAGHLGRVVEGVLYDLGLLEVALLQPEGSRRGANLRKAVAVAREMERSGREGLDDLLRRLEMLRDREVAESEAALGRDDEDVVRINTVHGAKGLEYPVVILADIGRKTAGGRETIHYDGEGGFAARLVHPLEGESVSPAGFDALAARERALEEEESRRLLYVATTRAEERLLLVGSCAGRKKDGSLKEFAGWGPWVVDALGVQPDRVPAELTHGRGRSVVRLVDPLEPPAPAVPTRPLAAPSDAVVEAAEVRLRAASEPVAPLGDTPYAVTVSELLEFAASPARHRMRQLEPRVLPDRRLMAEPDDPASGEGLLDPEAARREERVRLWDEPEEAGEGGLDRAGVGRALHALLETLPAGATAATAEALERVLEVELGVGAEESAGPLLQSMVGRYAASRTGRAASRALAAGLDVRREIAFHARIRFPAGATVAGFDSLLVRGSVDLWLPDATGRIHVVDHKTNSPSARLPTPDAVATHYAWQLRLYALATERLRGEDVGGAGLLLLDPGWGPDAVEVDVDVSGPALEEARRLCRAYAVAALEDRWPESWNELLVDAG